MRKVFLIILSVIFCSVSLFAENTAYLSKDKQEYIFGETSSDYGYLYTCVYNSLSDAQKYRNSVDLPAKKYKFKKLYIESILKADDSYTYYSIVIEPGERYVYKCYGSIEKETFYDFRKYDDYLSFQDTIANHEPLYLGSSIYVIDGRFNSYGDQYIFNNGGSLYTSEWAKIVTILDYLKADPIKKEKVASLLSISNLAYSVDDFDEIAFIEIGNEIDFVNGKIVVTNCPLQLYVGIKDGRVWGRLKAIYQSSNWLFTNSITIGADKEKWDSGDISFERETTDDGVIETMDIPADEEIISFMERFCTAKEKRIRFRGDTKYTDRNLRQEIIDEQTNILALYRAMTD